MTDHVPGGSHLLVYLCLPLLVLAVVLSFYRFVVSYDYIVEYEGECDPTAESCFVACEDEACEDVYYYTVVEKHAADLYAVCGPDITDCAEASVCLPDDRACSVTYCDPAELDADGTCASVEAAPAEDDEGEEVTEAGPV